MKTSPVNKPNGKPAATIQVFAIPDSFRELMEANVDDDGVLSTEGMEKLEQLLHNAKESILNLSCYVKECELTEKSIREIANSTLERARQLSARIDKYKVCLLKALEVTGHAKLSDPRICVAIQNNPASVWIEDERALPPNPDYFRIHKEPDRSKLKELLKSGQEIPGVHLIVTKRVSIK
jgi:hypothetical protein